MEIHLLLQSGHFIELLSDVTVDCCHIFTLKVLISQFFSLNAKTVWLKYSIYVWQSTAVALCQFPHQLLMKGGAVAQRSHDLQQEGEERFFVPHYFVNSWAVLCMSLLLFWSNEKSFLFSQAGDKHYHPSCARCSRCNQMFTEGEEMYLQGV